MSLILDALRKSEAERRRGQPPGLFADTVPALASVRSHRTAGIMGVIVVILLLVAAFYWPRPDASPSPATQASLATDIEPSGQTDLTNGLPPLPAARPTPLPQPPPAIAESGAIAPAAVPAAASASAQVIPKSALPASSPSPASEPSSAVDALVSMPPPEESIPPIAILGASERAALPPMKLSMHVWNSDASKRFAIIDGQRIAEGSLLGSSVVEEIRRDGVVLNINGRRVLLSRP